MCQAKSSGGKRCAAHTRPAFLKVMGTDPTQESASALARRLMAGRRHLLTHAATRQGKVEVQSELDHLDRVYAGPVSNAREAVDRAVVLAELRSALSEARPSAADGPSVPRTPHPSEAEMAAVHSYTGRGEISFWDLNNKLRRRLDLTAEEQAVVSQIQSLAAKTPAPDDYTVLRGGARFDRLFGDFGMTNDLTGKCFTDRSFASTTTRRSIMEDFARGTHKWQMTIEIPRGTPVVDVAATLGSGHEMAFQEEHLLPPGTRYRIIEDSGPGTVPRCLRLGVRPPARA